MMGNVVEHLETHISHRMTIYYDVKGGEFFLLASAGFLFFCAFCFFSYIHTRMATKSHSLHSFWKLAH